MATASGSPPPKRTRRSDAYLSASSPPTKDDTKSASKKRKLSNGTASATKTRKLPGAEDSEIEQAKENRSPTMEAKSMAVEPTAIWAPSRKSRGSSKNNVAFEVGLEEDELDLGFKDVPVEVEKAEPEPPTRTPRGRPKKLVVEVQIVEPKEIERTIEGAEKPIPKRRGRPPKAKPALSQEKVLAPAPETSELRNNEEPAPQPPKRRGRPPKAKPSQEESSTPAPVADIGRPAPEQPKRRGRPPKPKPDTTSDKLVEPVPDSSSDSEDDELCAVCQLPDSEPPNEILFCDNCDRAFHQECCEPTVVEIPEDDWLCVECDPSRLPVETEVKPLEIEVLPAAEEVMEEIGDKGNSPDIFGLEGHLGAVQRVVLEKLTGRRALKLVGLEEEFGKVHQVVEQTVVSGEGNSMLVIGARGCGKTALVNKVIADLSEENRENFHVVRLNGFIHTDDKLALRDIWRQLGKEMDVEEDLTSRTNNYADTLASLLALLSHPEEISAEQAGHTAKSVVFILDEFDLFTHHARQTLLYNLFDIAQARKAPICVLGVTTRIDVVEMLEKRVKSRFSHRYIHLPLPRSLAAFKDICKQGLTVDDSEIEAAGHDAEADGVDEFLTYWDNMINNLYEDPLFTKHLATLFYRTKSVPSFFTTALLPISTLTSRSLPLKASNFLNHSSSTSLSPPDSKLHLLPSLPALALSLLISAARLDIVLDTDTCNFSMAYDEYSSLTSRHKIQSSSTGIAALGGIVGGKVWGREVAMGEWERLVEWELLMPANMGGAGGGLGSGGMGGGGVGRENKMWRVDVALEEIPGAVEGLGSVMVKWCREI